MAKIKAKNHKLNGPVCGARFVDGEAETNSAQVLAFFRKHSDYTVTEDKTADAPKHAAKAD